MRAIYACANVSAGFRPHAQCAVGSRKRFNPINIVCMEQNISFDPHWPSEHVDDFVKYIGLVPGDVATIRIGAKSFVRVFIYKMKSDDPEVTISHDGVL